MVAVKGLGRVSVGEEVVARTARNVERARVEVVVFGVGGRKDTQTKLSWVYSTD